MENSHIGSSIRDNHARGKVGDFLHKNLEVGGKLSVVSAFFTIYAYDKLRTQLDGLESVRFLFGEPRFLKSLDPEKNDKKAFQIEDDTQNITLENRLTQKSVAKDCAEWIKKKVEIKSLVRPNFLHGKMYHIERKKEDAAILGSSNFTVNGLGLGQKPNIELNQILHDRRDIDDLKNWFEDFWDEKGKYSDIVKDVKDEVLSYLEELYTDHSPQFVYFKTLYHIFEDYLNEQEQNKFSIDEKTGFYETKIWNTLYNFQKDGVRGAINKILKYNGCVIADSVGLGKTFEALAVIKYFETTNNKVLVICPKKLRENWVKYTRNDKLNNFSSDRFSFDTLSHTDLTRKTGKSGDINLETLNWGNYNLIVIDESHNFRNNKHGKSNDKGEYRPSAYEFLMKEIIQKGVKTKVLLLSATPVNNSLKDLRNQIYLITENQKNALAHEGIKDIEELMRVAQTQFTNWAKSKKDAKGVYMPKERHLNILLESLDAGFFKLLDMLTIARSRQHIEKYYDTKDIGKFPTRNKVISVYPNIDLTNNFPSYDKIYKEISNYRLALYNPTAYVKEEFQSYYENKENREIKAFKQDERESFLIGMMRVNFLKRLESSIESFQTSIQRTIEKITLLEAKIAKFELAQKQQKNATDKTVDKTIDISELVAVENDEEDDDMQAISEEFMVGKKIRFELQHLDLELWKKDLKEDIDQLKMIGGVAKAVTPDKDEKLHKLKQLIEQKVKNQLNKGNKKVLVFTAFADTAYYLYKELEQWATTILKINIAVVAGGDKENKTSFKPKEFKQQTEFNAILTNFSPISKERALIDTMPQKGEIDLLIATDCISEGQNLQDCDYLVNYDIHWNPVRIIQRFGRIDRLGSKNNLIQMVNFWPTKDLNKYINLKDRVEARMALVDLTATGEENLLSTDVEVVKDLVTEDLKYRDQQLLRLKEEVLDIEDLQDSVSIGEFSLGDFRADLNDFLGKYKRILRDAPLGIYALVPAPQGEYKDLAPNENKLSYTAQKIIQSGVIFCLKAQTLPSVDTQNINPLQPFFLVYVRKDGTVRYSFSSVKQILEIYRLLCREQDKAYEKLCDLFNKETKQGQDTTAYSDLLKAAIKDIDRSFSNKIKKKLGVKGAVIPKKSEQINEKSAFELITWLVIK